MTGDKRQDSPWLSAERLGAFTDGVIAIIITILVLEIHVPEDHDFGSDGVLAFLMAIQHEVLVYLLSFLLVLAYWLQHHVMMHYVVRTDRPLILLNGLFLFVLSLSPFSTSLAGTYRGVPVVETVFGLTYFLSGVVFYVMWRYATASPRLLRAPLDPAVRRSMDRRILAAPLMSLAGVAVALWNFHVAAVVFLAIPLCYLRHWLVDTGWQEAAAAQ